MRGHAARFGKSGKRQVREMRNPRLARVLREMLALPGREVLKFRDGEGLVDVRRRQINHYMREVMGERFSAKDFRTWAGTLICACALARAGTEDGESRTARKRKLVAAIGETADHLGNTVAVCRSSYINPSVLTSFEKGRVIGRYFKDCRGACREALTRPVWAGEGAPAALKDEGDRKRQRLG